MVFNSDLDLNDLCNSKNIFTENHQIVEIFKELKSKYPADVFNSHKVYLINGEGIRRESVLFFQGMEMLALRNFLIRM